MPSLKEYKEKLSSLDNTRKITRTMKMVAASKLYRAMESQRNASDYAKRLLAMISKLAAELDPSAHPLLQPRKDPRKTLMLVMTSDKGLCGSFNHNMIKSVARWLRSPMRQDQDIKLSFCGRRGYMYFRKRAAVHRFYEEAVAHPAPHEAAAIGEELQKEFLDGAFDEIYVAYNHFINPISQTVVIKKILPIESLEIDRDAVGIHPLFILEPSREELLARLLPLTIDFEIYYALLENAAGENGARMTAMDNATANADKMIDTYTLLRNRARQATITTELTEIISGAEALNG